jgi:hypothetical protein
MANDKKFIVKNGLQSQENVVIGSTVDNGTDKLQVTGSAKIVGAVDVTQSSASTPTVKFTNSAGPLSLIAEFKGDSESIQIENTNAGDYSILNTGQDNGFRLYSDTDGVEILYNGVTDIAFNSVGIDFKREPTYLGDVFWNAGNDGAGSGLDADLIDGLDSTQFLRSDESDTMNGSLTITGDLTVSGTTTTINTEEILLADNIITLNSNYVGSAPSENSGIEVERGTLTNASFQWLEASDKWSMAGPSLGLVLGDASTLQGSITSYANSFIIEAGGASGVSDGTVFLSGKLGATEAEAGVASFYNQGSGVSYGELRYNGVPKLRTEANGTVTAGNARIQGSATIGTGSGGAYIYLDGAGNNGTIYSSAGEIGFLNTSFNYALKVDAAGDVQVTDDIYAQKFIDINDNTYEVIPSGVSSLNNIDLEGALRHNGETNTLINFPASDQVGFTLGGAQQGLMTTASFQYTGDVIADKFIDRNDNAFFLDPAGLSELHSANFYSGATDNTVNIGISADERFSINATAGQGYIRYIQDDTNATDHSVNFEIVSSGIGLNRFNFNKNINAGGNEITGGFGVFSSGVYAPKFYDYDDETYFADFNNVGNSINMAGTIEGGNGTSAAPTYTFGSDTNTGMFRGAADRLDFTAGGNVELQVNTTYTSAPGSFRAPIFYDTDNTGYYGNFAGTSVMARIELDDYIQHKGDTNNYFGFGANDTFRVWTNAVQRLNIDNDSANFAQDVYAPKYYDSNAVTYYSEPGSTSVLNNISIDDYVIHNGDTNTYVGFDATDQFGVWTNAAKRLNITNTAATFTNNVYAPRLYTNDYLTHNGDTNTYIGFDAADQFGVWTNGVKQIAVSATKVDINLNTDINAALDVTGRSTLGNSLTRPDDLSDLSDSAVRIGGSDVHLHIASLAAAGDYAVALQSGRESDDANFPLALQPNGGNVGVGTTSAGATLTINKTTAQGNNPFTTGTSLLTLGDAGVVDYSIRTDAVGNIYHVNDNGGNQYWYDTGAGGKFAIFNDGSVVAGSDSFINGTPAVTTNFITTPAANKFHSAGGISIEGKNSLLSIYQADGADAAVNEATFLGVNELGFSAGGGFYMDEPTTVKVRGNKDVFTTGNLYAGRFYDGNDNNYYADPASTSIMNRIDLDDYVRHNGDTNTYFGFSAADTFKIFTGGSQQVNIDNDSANFSQWMYGPRLIDSADNDYLVHPSGTSVLATIELDDYIQHKGNTDAYFGFSGNNNYKLFTNGVERFNVDANSADFAVNVYAPRYYDSNDSAYYVDPATTSVMNNISFGVAGSANTKGRFLSIEGNADASGEGSSRIFFAEHNSTAAAQDRYGMSLAYQGGSNSINSVTGQPVTLQGTSNGTWALIGHNNSVNGNWAMRGPRDSTYVEARIEFRAPRFTDSNNTAYYADPASTSVMNVVRANQFQVDGSTYTIDSPSGDYGSIKVDGAKGGWAGYVIRDDWAFMSNGTAQAGIYNDTRNEWVLRADDNNRTEIYANGVAQLSAENGYGKAANSMRSPIYYPPSGTTRFLDLDSVNGAESLKIGGEIFREGFAANNGADNKFLTAQDQNQWIWNTASNWGIAWATNTTSAYRHAQFGDNMLSFVGAGTVRAAIDLDSGNAYFQNEVSAGNFALSAGGENISLNPQYGSGLADETLFDGSQYWEKRNTAPLQGNESNNILTSEYVKNGDGPFSSSYVVRTNQYRVFYSDMISVEPGEEVYGEIWTRVISGSGGRTYYGIERYDKDKKPIAGNTGTSYFVAGGTVTTSTSWQKFSAYHTIPTSHGAYNGSDGAGVKYIRIRILMNHSTGGALREYGPPILKRVDGQMKLYTSESLYVGTNATIVGDLTVDDITADNVDANRFRDKTNTARYMDPVSGGSVAGTWNFNNGNIQNVNAMTFNDPGPNEGITWNGGSGWKIYESPDNLTTNTGGNLQIVQGTTSRARFNTSGDIIAGRYMDATRFRDSNNVAYYADPASTSIFAGLTLRTGGLMLERGNTNNAIWFNGGTDANHALWNQYQGGPGARGAAGSGGFDGMYWNTYAGLRIRGGSSGAFDIARFNTTGSGSGNAHYVQLYANNVEQLGTRGGYAFANNSMRSPLFYDSNDTTYYGNFASTSRMNVINANMYSMNDGWDIYDDSATTMSIRSNNSDNGTIIFRDSNSTDCGRIYFDDDSHWGFKTPDNEWSIYMERNARTILYYNGGQQARTQNGYFEANNQLRTPIMYDSNNTAYKIDGNGTSRLLTLQVDNVIQGNINGYSGGLLRKDNRTIEPNEDPAGRLTFGFTSWANNNSAPYADYLHMRSYTDSSGGSDNLVTFKKSGIGMKIWQQSFNSGTAYSTYRNVAVYNENPDGGGNSLYANIFYDEDDTGYKLDLTSTSNSAQRIRGGALHGPNPTWGKYLLVGGDGRQGYVNNTSVASVSTTNGNLHLDSASGYSTYINYYDGNTTYFGNGANSIAAEINSAGNSYFPTSYDRNNTAYYSNPASTSVMSTLDVRGEIYNDGWFRNDSGGRGMYSTPYAQHWMAVSNTNWRLYGTGNTQAIQFATSGNNVRGHVYADNSNNIGFLNQAGSWALRTNSGTTEVYGNLYANIMYDRNNSGYYVDPNATSNLSRVNINAQSYMNTQKAWVASNYGHGVYGLYSSTRMQHVWSMGTSYNLPANGTSSGNLYGLSWSHTNHGGQTKSGLSHQLLIQHNGTTRSAIGTGMWTSGISTSTNSFRAPIFYDTNNTAYYFNGASVNSTRFEGVSARTKAQMNISGQTRSSAETFMRRPNYTSDTNYWVGSMGWGTQDFNTVGNWGSGFIDTWSNPGNQPSGTSHWVGTQAFHYSNGSSRYGWQMVGGPIENLRFRSTWGGFRTWRTIPVLGVNSGNGAAIYASSFIDSNNTGFYCDPSSGTNLNGSLRATEIYSRSWLRNDNARTGMYNQATGSHSYSYQGQYWAITGNNNSSSMSLQLRATYNGTMCRWMYGDRTYAGDLNAAGQWQLQTRHTDGYSPTLRFIESGNESWTGNIGNDAGKIEYHSNRFYIEAGGNSTLICQFRRNGSNRSYIDNNGLYVGTATSARWADLAERYTADAIYENATVLGVNLDGDSEATLWQPGMPLLGVISTNPAVQMNDMGIAPGSTSKKAKMNPFIALKGRIPCLVNGDVKKGQWVIPDADGKAKGVDYGTPGVNSYEIIGIALSDSENGEVEVKV